VIVDGWEQFLPMVSDSSCPRIELIMQYPVVCDFSGPVEMKILTTSGCMWGLSKLKFSIVIAT
jgi:hypothetical protein